MLDAGLGQMGHGMAKNIRQKIPAESVLVIYDINQEVMRQFVQDFSNGFNVRIASSPKQVAELAVSNVFASVVSPLRSMFLKTYLEESS